MKEIILEKVNEKGNTQLWYASINGADYTIVHGIKGGKMQKETKTVREGKNIGKENETSAEQQAEFQVANKARKKIENSDYILIKGKEVLDANRNKEVKEIATNIPRPMLAHDGRKRLDKLPVEKFWVQPKLDGYRCLGSQTELYTRKRKLMTGKIPHLLPYMQEYFKILDAAYLDGEAFSNEIDFNTLQSILNKKPEKMTDEDREKAKTIKFNMFDYIPNNPNDDRMSKINSLKDNEYVKIVKAEIIHIDNVQTKHDEYVSQGHEGLIIRIPYAPYENKRSYNLLKYKVFDDEEAEIIGFKSEKNNPDKLGSLTMRFKNGVTFDARPKITHDAMDEMFNNQDKYLGTWGTVRFQGKMPGTNKPRFPRYVGIRGDDDILDEEDN